MIVTAWPFHFSLSVQVFLGGKELLFLVHVAWVAGITSEQSSHSISRLSPTKAPCLQLPVPLRQLCKETQFCRAQGCTEADEVHKTCM